MGKVAAHLALSTEKQTAKLRAGLLTYLPECLITEHPELRQPSRHSSGIIVATEEELQWRDRTGFSPVFPIILAI